MGDFFGTPPGLALFLNAGDPPLAPVDLDHGQLGGAGAGTCRRSEET